MPLDLTLADYLESDQLLIQNAFEQLDAAQQEKMSWMTGRLLLLHADAKTLQTALVLINPVFQTLFLDTKPTVENIARLKKANAMKGLDEKTKAIQKILMSMATDVRVLILACLEASYELQKIDCKNASAQDQEKAQEALEIFSPLLNKLGMNLLKKELEDFALRTIDPTSYERIVRQLNETKTERENYLSKVKEKLETQLQDLPGVVIKGRVKHIYSIWKKLQKYQNNLSDVRDLTALRVIVGNVPQCYEALGKVHALFPPVPGRFKDYIAKPKPNGYQSLHTTVMGPDEKLVEIQIRTQEMHQYNEIGVAAHFRYKGHTDTNKLDKRLMWLRETLEFNEKEGEQKTVGNTSGEFFENEIFVFTPKGNVIELEEGSTPIDFAYAIHSDIGQHCVGAKVNGKQVPLDYRLQNADQVEVITSDKQTPKRQWLVFVKTLKARAKIRSFLQLDQTQTKPTEQKLVEKMLPIKSIQITSHEQKEVRFAKCCRPVPGDAIKGFLTTKRKITVHRKDCQNSQRIESESKLVKVEWNLNKKELFEVSIRVLAQDQPAILTELLTIIANKGGKVSGTRARNTNQMTECAFELEIKDLNQLEPILNALSAHKWVKNASRI